MRTSNRDDPLEAIVYLLALFTLVEKTGILTICTIRKATHAATDAHKRVIHP